MVAPNYTYL
jgi:hypothetical protein